MKAFFVHHNWALPGKISHKKARGFTAYVMPHLTDSDKVVLNVAFCNPKDQFCKAIGRAEAQTLANAIVIDKRRVPSKLEEYAKDCYGGKWWVPDFNYVLKYFF